MNSKKITLFAFVLVAVSALAFYQFKSNQKGGTSDTFKHTPIKLDPVPTATVADAKGLLARIESTGVSSGAAKQMLATYFEWKITPKPSTYNYWQSTAIREAGDRILKYEINQAKRQALVAAFGPSIAEDPEFFFIFQPYYKQYPFLSASKQLEMERISLEVDRALINSGVTPIEAQDILAKARKTMNGALEHLLTKDEFTQYQLRESSAAKTLANSGFSFTQSEFDAMYATLPQDSGVIGLKRFDAEAVEHARGILGEERFIEYRKVQDPMYQMLSTIVTSHGIPNADINAAYKAIYQSQQETSQSLKNGPIPKFEDYEKKKRLQTDLKVKLNTLIGNDATDIFLRSLEANRGLTKTKLF